MPHFKEPVFVDGVELTGGGNGVVIGDVVTDGAAGAMLFLDADHKLAQDSAKLSWSTVDTTLTVIATDQARVAAGFVTAIRAVAVASNADGTYTSRAVAGSATVDGLLDGATAYGIFAEASSVDGQGLNSYIVAGYFNPFSGTNNSATQIIGAQIATSFMGVGSTSLENIGLLVGDQTGATANYAIKTGLGKVLLGDVLQLTPIAIGSLPGTPSLGMVEAVTDALNPVLGSTVGSGGSAKALVWYNGANWTVVGK